MRKKVLCCVLAVCMALALLPGPVQAAEIASGTCGAEGGGSNLTWTLDDAGTLTISGTGKMGNYGIQSDGDHILPTPWESHKEEIKVAIIESGVSYIGTYAFENCNNLLSAKLTDGVTSIGDSAFLNCSSLTSVEFPDSVISIGDAAFLKCTSLASIELPNNITTIQNSTFASTGLISVTIPKSVTSIEYGAFSNCTALESVEIPDSVTSIVGSAFTNTPWYISKGDFPVVNGVLLEYQGTDTEVTIPDSVVFIGARTFANNNTVTKVIIPHSVTSIEEYAFYNCDNLTSVMVPDSVTTIGGNAFLGCSSLTSVEIPNSVTTIGDYAFQGCGNLTSVILSESITTIGKYVFRDCRKLSSVTIPDGVTTIGDEAFCRCTALTSVTIPESVTTIEKRAFASCTSLTDVVFSNGVTFIGTSAFWQTPWIQQQGDFVIVNGIFLEYRGTDAKVTIPDGVTSIAEHAFLINKTITDIIIPDTVTSIGNYAFNACDALTNVTILGSATFIGKNAFVGCTALNDIFYGSGQDSWDNLALAIEEGATVHYTATVTPASATATDGKIVFTSDTDLDPTEAVKPEHYTIASEAAPAARSIGATPESAVLSNNNRTLTLTLSGTEETDQLVSVTIPAEVFAVPVQNNTVITVTMTGTKAPPPEEPKPTPEPTPSLAPDPIPEPVPSPTPDPAPDPNPSRPSNSSPSSTSTPTPTPTLRVERVEKETLVQTPPPVVISGEGESEYQDIVKDGEYVRWIDRLDVPRYAMNLYKVLCIGGDYDTYYDVLINDQYYQFPTGGSGSKGTAEVESVLELVSDLNLPYSSGNGMFQENQFAPGFDTINTTLGDRAVDYLNLKEGDVVRTSTYNAIYVSKLLKDDRASYDTELKAACAYAHSVFQAFDRDHPEVFWLSGKSKLRMVTVTFKEGNRSYQETFIFFVLADKDGFTIRDARYNQASIEADIQRRDQAVEAILKTVTAATPYEQAAQLNRWLTEHNEYNTSQDLQSIPNWPHECLSALVGSIGTEGPVCDGYARAFQVLCGKLGIPCVLVDGYAKVKADSAGEFHMWNSVQMPDGKWYGVDVTWNDPTVKGISGAKSGYEREDFLLVGADTVVLGLKFSESHPPKNRAADGGIAFLNGPTLSTGAFTPLAAAGVLPFEDIKPEDWYYDAVSDVFERGLMTGQSGTEFAPQGGMTRAMVWTVLGRMAGAELAGGNPWYASAQAWAVDGGLTDGSAPERTLSREELVTMLWRAEGSPAAEADLSAFADSGAVSAWAAPAVRWAVSVQMLEGSGGRLNPGGKATRAEVAALLTRYQGTK